MPDARTLHTIKRVLLLVEKEAYQAEERIKTRSIYGPNVYESAMISDIRADAKVLRDHLISICTHFDSYYNPPNAAEETRANCELCGKVWATGTSRDSEVAA